MHLHNPVDWYPWGPEAFAKAKKEGKLVFLSIGYSSCYWCHVMERESFENEKVAKLLNEWFVCIKVDREERPDVDNVYMTSLNVTGQRGGWPLSMFLTSSGKPIFGGTYWPADDKGAEGEAIPGFKTILQRVHQLNSDKPKELERQADKIAALTEEELAGRLRGIALTNLDRSLVEGAVRGILEEFDRDYGGFGSSERRFGGTKFPMPPYLELLLHEASRRNAKDSVEPLTVTLAHMARGGIYDHLGGGFHRYSTERTWTVPHFEKMLYDNAQLVEVFAKAFRLTHQTVCRRIVEETLAFVKREMTAAEGGFYSALDAETNGEEGRFYVWTDDEISDALGSGNAILFKNVYGLDKEANFEGRYHILTLPNSLDQVARAQQISEEQLISRLTPEKQKLLQIRAKRPRPFLDTKVLTAWNGQMIAGLAVAGQVLERKEYVESAARAADFILTNLRTSDGRLLRTYGAAPGQAPVAKINAYLDDYAFLIHGLLCLHDASGDARWLEQAETLTDVMIKYHLDDDRGGFYYTARDHEKLFARAKDQYDGVQPSGNSVAAHNFVRLWLKTGKARYQELAEKTIKAFSANLKVNPTSMTAMAEALAIYLDARDHPQQTGSKPGDNPAGQGHSGSEKKPKKSEDVVKIEVSTTKPDRDLRQTVTVAIAIDKTWHLYANPVPADFPGIPTALNIEIQGKVLDADIVYPRGKLVKDKVLGDYYVYEDKVKLQATVKRTKGDTSPLSAIVKVQACSDKQCLLQSTVKVGVRED
jgi:uncharacterized protein YyaL (SSP411 family)